MLAAKIQGDSTNLADSAFSLPIEGMTCASCVARIERSLNKVEGVQSVNVNLATERADIQASGFVDRKALVQAVVDISGRPYLVHSGEPAGFELHLIGGHFTGSMVRHVFEAISFNAAITTHITVVGGRDPHHIAEAEFKAFARAFRQAKALDPLITGIPSTKGAL